MGDMLQAKQLNYVRTNENYIPFSDLDMISTHLFIYDTTHLFNPKQALAIRICYEKRCAQHKVLMPHENYKKYLSKDLLNKFNLFKSSRTLVDCGSMYLDQAWSGKKAGLTLIKLGYSMMFAHILKRGEHSMIAATNEHYKMSRTLNGVGKFAPNNTFIHPQINSTHLLVLMEEFNLKWLKKNLKKYHSLYSSRIEILPNTQSEHGLILNDQELLTSLDSESHGQGAQIRKSSLEMGKLIAS